MSRLARYFFQGLIFVVPLAVTAYVLWAAFTAIDGWIELPFPGLGVLVIVAAVTVVGILSRLVLTAPVVRLVERVLERMPFVKLLYGAIKDLLSAVVGEEKRFDKPVLVRVGDGVELIGFVTSEALDNLGLPDRAAVYVPQSYNFAGQTIVVPTEAVTPLSVSGAEAMTFVVSAGVSSGDRDAAPEAAQRLP